MTFEIYNAFWKDESGATAIEYGLLATLVSLTPLIAFGLVGDALEAMYMAVAGVLSSVVGAP
jgi:pilus assembly protein Flp/PilA